MSPAPLKAPDIIMEIIIPGSPINAIDRYVFARGIRESSAPIHLTMFSDISNMLSVKMIEKKMLM